MSELKTYIRQTSALTGRELKHWFRSKMQIFMALIQPVIWLGLFGFAMNGFINSAMEQVGQEIDYMSFLIIGLVIITALTTSMNAGMSVVWDRRFGFLEKLKAAPVPRGVIPLSKVLSTTVKAIIQSLLILIIGLAFGLKFMAGFNVLDFLTLILIVAMVALTFSSIFVALGLVIKNQDVLMGINMLLNLPLMFASGVLFPTASFPEALKIVANVNPLTYAADAARRVSVGDVMISIPSMSLGMDILVLVIVAVVITALGMFFARRGLKA